MSEHISSHFLLPFPCRSPTTSPRTPSQTLWPSVACTGTTGSTPRWRRAVSPAPPTSSPPTTPSTFTPATKSVGPRTVRAMKPLQFIAGCLVRKITPSSPKKSGKRQHRPYPKPAAQPHCEAPRTSGPVTALPAAPRLQVTFPESSGL